MDLLNQGGYILILIVALSIVILGLTIERWILLRSIRQELNVLDDAMEQGIQTGNTSVVEALLLQKNHFFANVYRIVAEPLALSREQILEWMEARAADKVQDLYRPILLLSLLAQIVLLLGLLGTVVGMIQSSAALAEVGLSDLRALIGGIAQALLTTAAGLLVAIPTMVIHYWIQSSADALVSRLEDLLLQLVNFTSKDQVLLTK